MCKNQDAVTLNTAEMIYVMALYINIFHSWGSQTHSLCYTLFESGQLPFLRQQALTKSTMCNWTRAGLDSAFSENDLPSILWGGISIIRCHLS